MSQEDDVKHAIDNVNNFIQHAKDVMADRMEHALREIAKLGWWQGAKAKDLAEEALGIGKYWNQ